MNVYKVDLEMFMLEQMMLNGIILCITAQISSQKIIWQRIVAGAVTAAIYGLAGAFVELDRIVWSLMNCLAGSVVLGVAFRISSVSQLVLLNLVFYAVSLFIGGTVYYLAAVPGEMEVMGGAVLASLFLWVTGRVFVRQVKLKSCLGTLWLCNGNESVEVKGFLDTGNNLYTNDGLPVIIVEEQVIMQLFNELNEQDEFNRALKLDSDLTECWQGRYCYVLCRVVNGVQRLICFRPDKVYIKWPGKPKKMVRAAVGLADRPLSLQRQYQALLHQQLAG